MKRADIVRIAEFYKSAPHCPTHPSYQVFVSETVDQFNVLVEQGYCFTRSDVDPYATDRAMFRALARRELIVFTGGKLCDGHPLSFHTSIDWTVNECFRAVHDVYGHGSTLARFSFRGEIEAYRNHAKLYSSDALPALFGETIGQLCYFATYKRFVPNQKCVIYPQDGSFNLTQKY